MRKKTRVDISSILFVNSKFVYFKRGGLVFRGWRNVSSGGAGQQAIGTQGNYSIVADSVERVESISRNSDPALIKTLRIHGVKFKEYGRK